MYKVIGTDSLATESVHDAMEWISLYWDRHYDREGYLEPGKSFQMCLIDSVRGIIHVISGNGMVRILTKTVPYKAGVSDALADSSLWYGEYIYVKMFFRDKEEGFIVDAEE